MCRHVQVTQQPISFVIFSMRDWIRSLDLLTGSTGLLRGHQVRVNANTVEQRLLPSEKYKTAEIRLDPLTINSPIQLNL